MGSIEYQASSIENHFGAATSSKKGCRSYRQPKQTSIHGKLCTAKNGLVSPAVIPQTGSAAKPPLWEKLRNSPCSFRHTFQFRYINITQTKMSSKKSGKGRFFRSFATISPQISQSPTPDIRFAANHL